MPLLPVEGAPVAPVVAAALLLVALPMLERLGLVHPTASAVIEATGASRSQAYALREPVHAALSTVQRPVGRPPATAAEPVETSAIVRAVRDFVFDHPGAVSGTGARRRYSDAFRHAVLDLAHERRDVPIDAFSEAVGVPEWTLRDWLEGGVEAEQKGGNHDVVHRDIKPENIILSVHGTVLIDFSIGVSSAYEPGLTRATVAGQGVGSWDYAAPEQLKDASVIDHARTSTRSGRCSRR